MRRTRSFVAWVLLCLSLAGSPSFAQDKPKKPKPARQQPQESTPYSPPAAWKSVEIGDYYMRRKNYRGALSRYQEAVTTDPDYARGYLGLGKACEKLHFPQKALDAYQKYLDLLPSAKDAEEAKAVHRSIEKLRRELKKSPSSTSRRAPASALKPPSS